MPEPVVAVLLTIRFRLAFITPLLTKSAPPVVAVLPLIVQLVMVVVCVPPAFVVATPPPLSEEFPLIEHPVMLIGTFDPSSTPPPTALAPFVAVLLLIVTFDKDVEPT